MAFDKLGSKFNSFFAMDADEAPQDDAPTAPTQPEKPKPQAFRGNKVVAMSQPTEKTAKIVVYEPRIYSDAKEIGSHLLNNKAVVVNFDRIDADSATRIVDFLTGLVFAISGEIKRIGEQIFLVTPANFQIDGSLAESLGVDADIQMTE
ncbi:MAG: cell division protein SepF [Lactobacillus sp.]|jgi:cell division inhibitor SepF|nr:cell division protein SepF [Lactobacillus sp.]MCI2032590.1 cell division protein SepF [Lactobacillus sp.]